MSGINLSEKYKGILYVLLAAASFSLMSLFLKLAGDLPSIEKSFFRNFVAIFFAIGVILKNKVPLSIGSKSSLKYLISRSVAGTIGIFGNFYAVDHLVLPDANMLNKLSPFFAVIFSYFLLKERVAPYQILCLILAFGGAMFIIKPGLSSLSAFPALIGALGGMGAGFAYTCVRLASQNGVKGPIIVLFFSVFSCLCSVPFTILNFVMPTPRQLFFLFMTGFAACGGQFGITAAYSHAPAREISVYDYSQVIFAALWGFLFLGERPDLFSVIGYIVIFLASFIMFEKKRKEAN
ncbi:MAG: DMT family transporter [Lachnospiraceae bacterium]|nr:DMT family transporter [Lachnospiraceae bacterium]